MSRSTVLPLDGPDGEAIAELHQRYGKQLYSFCLRELGNREDAEDATQLTFLNAFRGLARDASPEFESAWLYKIAENVCRNSRRSLVRRRRVETPRDLDELPQSALPAGPSREEMMLLRGALEMLPQVQLRAIVLREWQGLSYREVAEELGCSEAHARELTFRARHALALALREQRPRRSFRAVIGPWFTFGKGSLVGGGAKVGIGLAAVTATAVVGATTPGVRHALGIGTLWGGNPPAVNRATSGEPAHRIVIPPVIHAAEPASARLARPARPGAHHRQVSAHHVAAAAIAASSQVSLSYGKGSSDRHTSNAVSSSSGGTSAGPGERALEVRPPPVMAASGVAAAPVAAAAGSAQTPDGDSTTVGSSSAGSTTSGPATTTTVNLSKSVEASQSTPTSSTTSEASHGNGNADNGNGDNGNGGGGGNDNGNGNGNAYGHDKVAGSTGPPASSAAANGPPGQLAKSAGSDPGQAPPGQAKKQAGDQPASAGPSTKQVPPGQSKKSDATTTTDTTTTTATTATTTATDTTVTTTTTTASTGSSTVPNAGQPPDPSAPAGSSQAQGNVPADSSANPPGPDQGDPPGNGKGNGQANGAGNGQDNGQGQAHGHPKGQGP